MVKSVIRDRQASASGKSTNSARSVLLQRLYAIVLVGKELVAIRKAQLRHQVGGNLTEAWMTVAGQATQHEGEDKRGRMYGP